MVGLFVDRLRSLEESLCVICFWVFLLEIMRMMYLVRVLFLLLLVFYFVLISFGKIVLVSVFVKGELVGILIDIFVDC